MRSWARVALVGFSFLGSACPSDPSLDAAMDVPSNDEGPDDPQDSSTDAGMTATAAARTDCPVGTAGVVCAPCPAGSYCPGGRQPMALCNTYQYDDDQDPSTPCVAVRSCGAGTYVAVVYSRVTDQRCAPCPSGTFNAATDARSCTPFSVCESHQYEAVAPGPSQDRVCAELLACAPDEFVAQPGTPNRDRVCQRTTTCEPGELEVEPATDDSDRRCASCAEGTFSNEPNAETCRPWTECEAGQYEAVPGSATSDRLCAALSDCLPGEFRNANSDQHKQACEPCPSGEFSSQANARSCEAWTRCLSHEYETTTPSATTDRACAALTTCHPGEYVDQQPTATRDRSCKPCPTGSFSDTENAKRCEAWTECKTNEYEQTAPSAALDRACASDGFCDPGEVDDADAGVTLQRNCSTP